MNWQWPGVIAVSLALIGAVGCGSATPVEDGPPTEHQLESGLWDVHSGQALSLDELEAKALEATVIIVGESHGTEYHHDRQQELLERIDQGDRRTLGVGLEMIEARFQAHVEDYIGGNLEEEEFLEAVEWETRWGVDPAYYAPLWRMAREQGLGLYGLNAPRELVRAVGQQGPEGVDEQWAEELPSLALESERAQAYREHLSRYMGAHGHGDVDEEALDRFFAAQMVWDTAMAEATLEALEEVDAMFLVVGRGHMERRFGIPMVLEERGLSPDEILTVVPVSTSGEQSQRMETYRDLQWLQEESIADVVWVE